MNYKKIYDSIITRRCEYLYAGYTETHHIVPKSLGGGDDKENLVCLSSREHFICHFLLLKMCCPGSIEWYKMYHAFMMMKCSPIEDRRYYNSRLYERLKSNFSSIMSVCQKGECNSQYGTKWICNITTKENKKIKRDDIIPEGWVAGRSVWNYIEKNIKSKIKKDIKYDQYYDSAKLYWNSFHGGNFSSLNEFSKTVDISQQALHRIFKKYFYDKFLCDGKKGFSSNIEMII